MKRTIQFESHRNELAAILEMEHDPDVREFYDQPNSIQLHYHSGKGKAISALHTPDYFGIRQASAGWIECKTEDQLLKLATKVGSVDVKAPRDPNATVAPDEPAADVTISHEENGEITAPILPVRL